MQNSELELDIIEVDPETKEMLKSLVGFLRNIYYCHCDSLLPLPQDFGGISNVQVIQPHVGGYGTRRQ